ncbi:hypothetical protein WJX84_002774 [Apatococcus fuscideae]|uniref:Uncharacterized protein n=1 Tax=Apatococcus fuscideae TaxID=2026836 RepID=A0AAW1TGH7_9CHLO
MSSSSIRQCWASTKRAETTETNGLHALGPMKGEELYRNKATVYPAGRKQASIRLPAFVLKLDSGQVLGQLPRLEETLTQAIAGGLNGVLLSDSPSSTGASLYEAASTLKELLRGRATLLVTDRIDIVDAADADGVLLTPRGMPVPVARKLLQDSNRLVARAVATAEEATAAAAEGVNLLFLEGPDEETAPVARDIAQVKKSQAARSVPVVAMLHGPKAAGPNPFLMELVNAGVDGFALPQDTLQTAAQAFGLQSSSTATIEKQVAAIVEGLAGRGKRPARAAITREELEKKRQTGFGKVLDDAKGGLLDDERVFLFDASDLLREVLPEMEETTMLDDALRQLDELFLLVIVGEFNSGKSSVINALLGSAFLDSGILPTTNEISVLKYSSDGSDSTFRDQLPADILREINIVDTPGTNVVLERQQRLTEEYVPRADLVIFVMSADRPFAESEVKFLRYIRKWGKKILFVVNKVDMLQDESEVREVLRFVQLNAQSLLGVDTARVLPIAARPALKTKLNILGPQAAGKRLGSSERSQLQANQDWEDSRFSALESFIADYLSGGASSGEGVRLKLQTPLFVSEALLDTAQKQLADLIATAEQEYQAVAAVEGQLADFQQNLASESKQRQQQAQQLVTDAQQKATALVESALQLGNREGLIAYLFGSKDNAQNLPIAKGFQPQVAAGALPDLRNLVESHSNLLKSSCSSQARELRSFADARAQQLGTTLDALAAGPPAAGLRSSSSSSSNGATPASVAYRAPVQDAAAPPEEAASPGGASQTSSSSSGGWHSPSDPSSSEPEASTSGMMQSSAPTSALALVKEFDPKAASLLLEEEVREAVVGTVGTAVGAGAGGIILTTILQTASQDILAVGLAGLVAYASVLNLPARRSKVKAKLEQRASKFAQELSMQLQQELQQATDQCLADVRAFMRPVEAATKAELDRLLDAEKRRSELSDRLRMLQERAAKIE